MKNKIILIGLILWASIGSAQNNYYFNSTEKFNAAIPTPDEFFGFEIGKHLVRYDKVVEYFKLLADKSDRASLVVFGQSWEKRDQVKLIISSPDNQRNLEQIRVDHLKLIDPKAKVDYASQKAIVELAYNVHGGEIAGTDAAVLAAYYLVATENPEITNRLNDAVVLIEPSQNPDGRERATTFINGFHSEPGISDPADLGHSGGWTPHRGNHFWNDLNRDWLALSQIESRNRVAYYHQWYPNVYLDFHEMGSGSTYYFEPSPLTTWNNILPKTNYDVLTGILANYFSKALNNIGSLFFTKESFTNLSPIYGSTYPDYQGGAGITLEVGSTSGVVVETPAGIRTFSRNLKDNFEISIAGLLAATENKEAFLKEQKEFFESALVQADKLATKSIVFGSQKDQSLNRLFLQHLLNHKIEVYALNKAFTQDGKTFEPGTAYVVPLKQAQFRILQSIFEENETNGFDKTTTFYDVSGWSTVHGYGVPFSKSKAVVGLGERISELPALPQTAVDQSNLAYAFEYADYLAPKAVYFLQAQGIVPRVASQPFTIKTSKGEQKFGVGSIVIPVAYQSVEPAKLLELVQQASAKTGIPIHSISDGFSVSGIDLGSNNIRVIKQPKVALVSGGSWTSFGEIWALLSLTHDIPVVKLNGDNIERTDLNAYTSIILTGGQFSADFARKLGAWVENGGTLISLSTTNAWVNGSVFSSQRVGQAPSTSAPVVSTPAPEVSPRGGSGPRLNGVILRAELDLKSPLTYGIENKDTYTLKNNVVGLDQSLIDFAVLKSNAILVNGYADTTALSRLKESIVVGASSKGRGSVIYFAESPTFRGYWLNSSRLLTNAIFFGGGASSRRY
ncbi:M14 family zinc carboxypeptidase [Sphingobacterium hungaricum]